MAGRAEGRTGREGRAVISEIKARIAVADVLADAGVTLTRGRAACPLHGGDNPSAFSVRGERWTCFVCNAGGDVIDLAAALHGTDTRTSIRRLAERAGIRQGTLSPSERQALKKAQAERARKRALVKALDAWAKEQRNTLAPLLRGARRMTARGISYKEACKLGGEFFDSFAYLEYAHDEILAKSDRRAHLALFKEEHGL